MRIHARGLELVVELMEAADHLDCLPPQEHRALLREAAVIMGDLLARDVPDAENTANIPMARTRRT